MKILLFTLTFFLFGAGCILAQENEANKNITGNNLIDYSKKFSLYNDDETDEPIDEQTAYTGADINEPVGKSALRKSLFNLPQIDPPSERKSVSETDITEPPGATTPDNGTKEKFHWKPALIQSGIFLGLQHGLRFAQKKTTRQFGGPFFKDWGKSVRNLRGWRDGDKFYINYFAHPLQGGLTGRIFVNNSDRAKKQEFGKSKIYWESRLKAMAWSAVWSTQFELGPISEANLGNVGLASGKKYSTMSYVDLVITPIIGTGVLIGEDAIDKYILKNWLEKKDSSRTKIKILRTFLTPTTSFANLLRGKAPWKRDDRPL